jgi:hypothetical protein
MGLSMNRGPISIRDVECAWPVSFFWALASLAVDADSSRIW